MGQFGRHPVRRIIRVDGAAEVGRRDELGQYGDAPSQTPVLRISRAALCLRRRPAPCRPAVGFGGGGPASTPRLTGSAQGVVVVFPVTVFPAAPFTWATAAPPALVCANELPVTVQALTPSRETPPQLLAG